MAADMQPGLAERLASLVPGASIDTAYDQVTVDVPADGWVAALTLARDDLGFTYFDWLTAVDQQDGGFDVVAHVWSVERHEHLLLRTRLPASEPRVATATGVYAGASWHERETFEMFGVTFDGHPHLVPLLLPDGFEGHPLRKDFVLAARAAKAWPGAKEPGESEADGGGHGGSPGRRKTRPPGVPDPEAWGPRPPSPGAADPPPSRADQATLGRSPQEEDEG